MKKLPAINIDPLFYSGWLMVSQLRNGQEIADGHALYRRTCQWIDAWRCELTAAGVSQTSVEHLIYALCSLFDESVLNRNKQDSGYTVWLSNPLQAKYFNTLNAGEELWERIRNVLHEPSPDPLVLTCFYRVLQLGFIGRYRARDDEQREDVVQSLSRQAPPFSLTRNAPIISPAGRRGHGRRLYWLSWAAGGVALAGLWWFLSFTLERMVSHITELH